MIIELINYHLYKKNKTRGRLLVFLSFLIRFVLSLFLMFHPSAKYQYVMLIIGIYFGLYAFSQLNSFISEIIPNKIKNNVRISIPILISAFIPQKLITLINELLTTEKEVVKKRIHKLITTNVIDYYPDLQQAEMGLLPQKEYHDMSSDIYRYANGKFKKVIKGKWKTFFVLKTNCTGLVDVVLNGVGLRILKINGILTPGSYYDFLNQEFLKKQSNVIYRKIYTNSSNLSEVPLQK